MLVFPHQDGSVKQSDFVTAGCTYRSNRVTVHPDVPCQAPSSQEKSSAEGNIIRENVSRQLAHRKQAFRNDFPFSWPRFCIGLISLALCLSDVVRSGLGLYDLGSLYTLIEPDVAAFYDPWNYTIAKLAKDENDTFNMHNQSVRVWSYKFDSTSIAWRAFIRHFDLGGTSFPGCLLYTETCPTPKLNGDVAFHMINSLVDAVAATSTQSAQLRTVSMYVDRVHDFLLPQSFGLRLWRTNQALYYSSEELSRLGARICYTGDWKQPNFCQLRWVNYRRSCSVRNTVRREVGRILDHTLDRVRATQERYPNATVELMFIESQEDAAHVEGGMVVVGVRRSDISTVIRARRCTDKDSNACETVYIEDYRYEAGLGESNASQWYTYAASLRIIGQSYFFLRVFCLFLGCYFAARTPKGNSSQQSSGHRSFMGQTVTNVRHLRLALATFVRIPTQCIVFGSRFPVVCYALAHLIDAPIMYVVLEKRFTTTNGILHLNYKTFVSLAVVQMRNVWIFTILLHFLVGLVTYRRWNVWSHIADGVPGVPEFLLAGLSSTTIAAQFRSTTFRNTRILSVYQVPVTSRHLLQMIKHQRYGQRRGSNPYVLGGVIIDLKCLVFLTTCMIIVLVIAVTAMLLCSKVLHACRHPRQRSERQTWSPWWLILGSTPTPYSAGLLYPTAAMCVHWTRDFFCIQPLLHGPPISVMHSKSDGFFIANTQSGFLRQAVAKLATAFSVAVRMDYTTFSAIQLQMERIHDRRPLVEANIAFMNLVVMSDPLVYASKFMSLRNEGTLLGYYKSNRNKSGPLLLLPCEAVNDSNEEMQDLKLLRLVHSASLPWAEIIQCG